MLLSHDETKQCINSNCSPLRTEPLSGLRWIKARIAKSRNGSARAPLTNPGIQAFSNIREPPFSDQEAFPLLWKRSHDIFVQPQATSLKRMELLEVAKSSGRGNYDEQRHSCMYTFVVRNFGRVFRSLQVSFRMKTLSMQCGLVCAIILSSINLLLIMVRLQLHWQASRRMCIKPNCKSPLDFLPFASEYFNFVCTKGCCHDLKH
jgi:hypothetical protein